MLFAVTNHKITYYFSLTLRRVSRMITRLNALLEKTSPDSPDHDDLQLAVIELRKIAEKSPDM